MKQIMQRPLYALLAAAAIMTTTGTSADANSVDFMLDECGGFARQYFGDNQARTDMRDNGRRTDGTYAIGGEIFLEARSAYVACSFAPDMMTITEFFVDGEDQSTFLTGGSRADSGRSSGNEEQAAIDGCIDQVRAVTGGLGGEVLSSEFSQAGTLVRLRDSGGTEWECIGYSDGAVGDLRVAGSSSGASAGSGGTTGEQRVSFPAGSTGAELTGQLAPGASMRYVLGAQNGQDLYVRVAHRSGPRLDFQIFNPDGSFLLDMIPTDREYRGQLWQSGDHVVEVINRGGKMAEYNVIFGID